MKKFFYQDTLENWHGHSNKKCYNFNFDTSFSIKSIESYRSFYKGLMTFSMELKDE